MQELDVRRLACPGPVLELKRLLDDGEWAVRLFVADEQARSNVTRYAASRGARCSAAPSPSGGYLLTIVAGDGPPPPSDAAIVCDASAPPSPADRPLVVQVGSDTMGRGDDELGRLLLRSFLKTQLELEARPDAIVFYNSGVRLCCEGSTLLDDLARLEAEGVELIACGTCLSFLELGAALRVGRVTDMLEIASRLAGAARIVRP